MKFKAKLSLFIIILSFIPLLVLNLFYKSNLSSSIKNNFVNSTKYEANEKAEAMNKYLKSSLNMVNKLIESEHTEKLISYANTEAYVNNHYIAWNYENDFKLVNDLLNFITVSDDNVMEALLVNNHNDIIASTNTKYVNTNIKDRNYYKYIQNLATGISSFVSLDIKGQNTPVFLITKDIYNKHGELIGKYYQVNKTDYLLKILQENSLYNSSSKLIMDERGNVLDIPYDKTSHYTKTERYSKMNDFILQFLTSPADAKFEDNKSFVQYRYNDFEAVSYGTKIPIANWNYIVSLNTNEISSFFNRGILKFRIQSSAVFILFCIGVILIIKLISKPLDNIINVLHQKQRGDKVQFTGNSSGEFGEIGRAFNKMFDEVMDSEQRYRSIVEMTDNITFEINFSKNNVFVSNNFNKKFSFRPKTDSFQDSFFYKATVHKDDAARFRNDLNTLINNGKYLQGEYRFKNIYGDFIWILIRANKFFDRNDCPTKIIGIIVDIDKEKKNELTLLQKASYDALTKLYNRETFMKTLSNESDLAKMKHTLDAALFIDLDDFKHFNDQYGHACGDEVLQFTASTIQAVIDENGFAGRFGGDEFVVTLTDIQYYEQPGEYAQQIINTLTKGFNSVTTSEHLSVGCSIGIAFYNEPNKTYEEILEFADEAMYTIKKHGKSNFGYFSKDDGSIKHKSEYSISKEKRQTSKPKPPTKLKPPPTLSEL